MLFGQEEDHAIVKHDALADRLGGRGSMNLENQDDIQL